jgi:hypothetical protein
MASSKRNPYYVNYYSRGGVALIPNAVLESENYLSLNNFAPRALLIEITKQYNGHNNGDLSATRSLLKDRGFNSQETITRSIRALEVNKLIQRTRQGGKNWATGANLPTLFAITWQPINECKGKLDIEPTSKPFVNFIASARVTKNSQA